MAGRRKEHISGRTHKWLDVKRDTSVKDHANTNQQTLACWQAIDRSWLPDWFGGIFWFGVDDAASSCYVPMFCGIDRIPMEFAEGNGSMTEYSNTAAFWTFTKVSNFVYSRYCDMIKHVNEKQAYWETKFLKDIDDMTDQMKTLCNSNPDKARQDLNAYSAQASRNVCKDWNDLFIYLLVKYNDGNVKKEENGKFKVTGTTVPQCEFPDQPRYRDEWYKMIVNDCGSNIESK